MVRLNNVPKGDSQWYSTHTDLPTPELEASRLENLSNHTVPLEVKPTKVIEVGSKPDPIEEDVYYFPTKPNLVGIDSYMVSGGRLYLFQFTVGQQHPVKPGLRKFLKAAKGIPAEANWRFVFIIPKDIVVKCPHLKELGTLPMYSAAVDVELKSLSV